MALLSLYLGDDHVEDLRRQLGENLDQHCERLRGVARLTSRAGRRSSVTACTRGYPRRHTVLLRRVAHSWRHSMGWTVRRSLGRHSGWHSVHHIIAFLSAFVRLTAS